VKRLREGEARDYPFDAFFVCNPDIYFLEDSITPLVQVLASSPSIGAVGPALLNEDVSIYPSARAIPSVATGIGHGLFVSIWPNNPWTRAYKSTAKNDEQRDAGWLSGAAVMVKASIWDELGGFDEGYFLNFEDIDLGFRIGQAGYTNVYVPTTRVVHSGGHSLKKHAEASERAMHESAQRFMRKRYAGVLNSPIRWAVLLGLRIRGALTLRSIRKANRK
jgi:N-acetylglucosaminyl-diphospho-decaprenol L-rhamnosyltransferase